MFVLVVMVLVLVVRGSGLMVICRGRTCGLLNSSRKRVAHRTLDYGL